MTGTTYNIPPQPPVEANNHELVAGAITFGVEYRKLDPESLRATYAGNEEQLAELEARSPDGGFFDTGVSIHVCGSDDGYEYLRFDVFDDEPHYHYVHRHDDGEIENQVIEFDATANGDMLAWVNRCLRDRLAESGPAIQPCLGQFGPQLQVVGLDAVHLAHVEVVARRV